MLNWKMILIGIVAAAAVSYHVYAITRARADGITQERIVWQERQIRAIQQAEADRKAAQAKINEIEDRYLATRKNNEAKLAELEAALEAERSANEKADPACPPAISRRLRDSLAPIGR